MVVFDANFLIYFLDPKIKRGIGNNPKVDYLVATIQKAGERIVIPTPALSELLVKAEDAGPRYLEIISRSKFFRVVEFGERAAVEAAVLTREALASAGMRGVVPEADRAKVKFDRQIVAIARVVGASVIYSNDDQLIRHARAAGIEGLKLDDLPDPPASHQFELELEPPEPEELEENDED